MSLQARLPDLRRHYGMELRLRRSPNPPEPDCRMGLHRFQQHATKVRKAGASWELIKAHIYGEGTTMDVRDIWLAKTDDEVLAAFAQLDLYTTETQAVIRAEHDRRALAQLPSDPAAVSASSIADEDNASSRRASVKAARAHLASLNVSASTTALNAALSSGRRPAGSPPGYSASSATESKGTSSDYEYKVTAFIGQSKGTLSANDVSRQLESVIAQHAAAGWEFCQLGDVNVEVQPGCLAGLFGASVHYVRFDQLIFKRRKT